MSVRAVVEEDFILCYLGNLTSIHVIPQESLDLEIAAGEEVVLYTESEDANEEYVVHLVGYYTDDPTESNIEMDDKADESESVRNLFSCSKWWYLATLGLT